MQSELLSTPTLTGKRFERHTLPADVLSDIAALQELLVSLAKAAYVAADAGRQRAPRNFDREVQLHLGPLGEGSTKLPLVLLFASTLFAPYREAFEQAQWQFTQAVDDAAQGKTPELPVKYLAYFDKIGRSLRSDEGLRLSTRSGETTLTQETRKRLLEASRVEEYTERATLRARVPATDYSVGGFKVELLDGTILPGKLDPTIQDQFADAQYRYIKGGNAWLLLEGVVRKDRSGKLKTIDSVEQVSTLDPLDVTVRLHDLSLLQDGWLDGSGLAPPVEGLQWLSDAYSSAYLTDLPLPHLYPTPEGGVQAEWDIERWSVSLEINLQSKFAEYLALELDTRQEREEIFDLNSAESWERLNEALQQLGIVKEATAS